MHSEWKRLSVALITLGLSSICASTPTTETPLGTVKWATEEWEGFTNKDGSGFYSQLLQSAFSSQNIQLKTEYAPFSRAEKWVRSGLQDITGCIPHDQSINSIFHVSKHEVFVNKMQVFFFNKTIDWQGTESLSGMRVAAIPGSANHPMLKESTIINLKNREQALSMVSRGRADFYIDDELMMRDFLEKKLSGTSDYSVKDIYQYNCYMVATKNPRGKKIIEVLDRGILAINESGELKKLFQQFQHTPPNYVK